MGIVKGEIVQAGIVRGGSFQTGVVCWEMSGRNSTGGLLPGNHNIKLATFSLTGFQVCGLSVPLVTQVIPASDVSFSVVLRAE